MRHMSALDCMVSIIVPVYNVEKYIEQCIKSVLSQSYINWELLLINDGSVDESGKICDYYQGQDHRIKVVHKTNTGVSDSRNVGLDHAKGKYIIFLDSDDYWYDNAFLEQLITLAEVYQLDIIRGEYKAVDENGKDLFRRKLSEKKLSIVNDVIDSVSFLKYAIDGEFFLVLSLFKRDAISTLRLNIGQIFLEDMRFYSMLLMSPMKCMYVPISFYAYRKNISSASNRINYKKLSDSFEMCNFFHCCALKHISQGLKEYFNYYSVMMYKWTLETLSLDDYYNDRGYLVDLLSLEDLRMKVLKWINIEHVKVSRAIFVMPPLLGIISFRIINKCREKFRYLKCYITSNRD